MVVGVCTLTLRIPYARSLKDRRSVVRSLCARIRARFNASVAEVGRRDALKEAVLAVAVVGQTRAPVSAALEQVRRLVEEDYPAELAGAAVEWLSLPE